MFYQGDESESKDVKKLFSADDVDALSGNEPIMIQGEDGVLYQVWLILYFFEKFTAEL